MYEEAAVAQSELNALGRDLAESCGGGAEYHPRASPRTAAAEDKIKGYGGDASQLKDLAGGYVSFGNLDELYGGLARLRNDGRMDLVKFEDRFQSPQKSGYRDVQMFLRASNGHIAEFRLQSAPATKPGQSPRGLASALPLPSLDASTRNGESAMKSRQNLSR